MPGCAPLPAPVRLSSHRAHVAAGLLGRWHRWSPVDGNPNLGGIRLCHLETQNVTDALGSLDVRMYLYDIYIYVCWLIHIHIILDTYTCNHKYIIDSYMKKYLPHKETSSYKKTERVSENRPVAVVAESMWVSICYLGCGCATWQFQRAVQLQLLHAFKTLHPKPWLP